VTARLQQTGRIARARAIDRLDSYIWVLGLCAVAAIIAALRVDDPFQRLAFFCVGGTIALQTGLIRLAVVWRGRVAARDMRAIMQFLEHDASPSFLTDKVGAVTIQNRAAEDQFGPCGGQTVNRSISTLFANPDAVVLRLRSAAKTAGFAREDVVTRRGHVRLGVQQIATGFLWRLENVAERSEKAGDGIALPMMTVSRSGTVLYMNEPLRAALGRRIKRIQDIFDDFPLKSGSVHTLSIDGESHPVRIFQTEGNAGRSEIYLFPSEAPFDETMATFLPVLDDLPVPLLHLNPDGTVLGANRLAQGLLPQLVGARPTVQSLVEGLGRSVGDWIADAAKGRGLSRSEVVRVARSSPERFLQITLGRIQMDGHPSLVAVLTDATELKTLEAQFVQSQKMQAIGQLAGGVAHDFNNLLTAISGHCDLLLLHHDKGDTDYADLMQISQNANRAAALVGQLLAFSRKQTLQLEKLDLRDTLGDLTHLLNRLVGERVRLSLSHDPGLMPIRADKRQMEQVMMNLVVNARDAMPSGGVVTIETRCQYLETELARDQVIVPKGQYVIVSVADEGKGIAPDLVNRIFEPFYTTKRTGEGTGLGLSMVYGIVKQTGGFIFADTQPGSGAIFSLYFPADDSDSDALEGYASGTDPTATLPRADAAPSLPSRDTLLSAAVNKTAALDPDPTGLQSTQDTCVGQPPAPVAPTQVRISRFDGDEERVVLLVEDEAPVRAFASRALRLRGYTVLEAACAEDALKTLQDTALNVDIFVTDVMMPGMDGPSWVKLALKDRPLVRTVFVSGYAQETFDSDRAGVPNSVFLPKPFSLAELTQTVQSQFH
jgi:two-component system cell cycle sensor histidine kinase/response regulator CckA